MDARQRPRTIHLPDGAVDRAGSAASRPGQTLSREVNEAIYRLAGRRLAVEYQLHLVCECQRVRCLAGISVRPHDYEVVRRSPGRFLTRADHATPDERVVATRSEYVVVERRRAAAERAFREDPRRHTYPDQAA